MSWHVFPGIEAALQLLDCDLGNSVLQGLVPGGLGHDAAEMLVIDEGGDGGMLAANRALGILAQFELAEAHIERIHQQQPAGQGLALAQDQLDHFRGLNDADQSGENPQNAALRATWHPGPAEAASG